MTFSTLLKKIGIEDYVILIIISDIESEITKEYKYKIFKLFHDIQGIFYTCNCNVSNIEQDEKITGKIYQYEFKIINCIELFKHIEKKVFTTIEDFKKMLPELWGSAPEVSEQIEEIKIDNIIKPKKIKKVKSKKKKGRRDTTINDQLRKAGYWEQGMQFLKKDEKLLFLTGDEKKIEEGKRIFELKRNKIHENMSKIRLGELKKGESRGIVKSITNKVD
jgi:hypothetical protein